MILDDLIVKGVDFVNSWQDEYAKALHFAALAHGEQKYPEKPYSYLVHLSIVSAETIGAITNINEKNVELDKNLAIQCAILHDTIEDTSIKYEDVEKQFGKVVADGVMALTKDEKLNRDLQMADSIARIKKQSKEIWIVKMADRVANLQTPLKRWSSQKIREYMTEAIFIHAELKQANKFLADRLDEKIRIYEKNIYI